MGGDLVAQKELGGGVFLFAVNDEQKALCAHDVSHAHGHGIAGHVVTAGEEAGVGVDGALVQHFLVSVIVKGIARLVEANMAVSAHAQKLDVDIAVGQNCVEFSQIGLHVAGTFSHIGVVLVDVDLVKKHGIHEIAVALVMRRLQANIFVQIHAVYPGEIQPIFTATAGQLTVHAHRAGAGGQTEAAIGLAADDLFKNICSDGTLHGIVFGNDNFQAKTSCVFL